jgi:hypothetical protein
LISKRKDPQRAPLRSQLLFHLLIQPRRSFLRLRFLENEYIYVRRAGMPEKVIAL